MADAKVKEKLKLRLRDKKNQEQANIESTQKPDEQFTEAEIYKAATSQQDGDAWLFYRIFKDQLCYDHSAGRWYEWAGHYWKEDDVSETIKKLDSVIDIYSVQAERMAWRALQAVKKSKGDDKRDAEDRREKYLKKISILQKKRWKQDVLELAASGKQSLAITGKEWDLDPWLLGCPNGVIELKTGTFRPGRQSDYIKTACPTEWKGIDEPCPEWNKFIDEILNNASFMTPFLQRLLGCSITGSVIEHIFPIFWGHGRNGKGTLFDILRFTLGSLAEPIKSEMLLDQGRMRSSAAPDSDIMALRGRRIVWGSETDEGRKLNIGKVKWLAGGDILTGREPYGKKEVSFTPTHTLFLLTNHKPKVDPNDYALWQRIHLIEFKTSFIDDPEKQNEKKRDPNLPEKLKAEASGILAWLVRGCLEWQKQGLNLPEIVKNSTKEYREEEDITGQFISERCTIDSNMYSTAGDLYKSYSEWCQEYGYKPTSSHKFSDYLLKQFNRDDTGRHRLYRGIGLKLEF